MYGTFISYITAFVYACQIAFQDGRIRVYFGRLIQFCITTVNGQAKLGRSVWSALIN